MNTSQMIMNTNSPMTVGINSWKIMNNLSHSEEANDQENFQIDFQPHSEEANNQENFQIDFNPIELFKGGEKCDS